MKWILLVVGGVALVLAPGVATFGARMAERWTMVETAMLVATIIGVSATCGTPLALLGLGLIMVSRPRRSGGGSQTTQDQGGTGWSTPAPTVVDPWSASPPRALPSGAMGSTSFVNRMRLVRED